MKTVFFIFSIVCQIVFLGINQTVNAQNNDTAKAKVDKLIEDTIRDNAADKAYRAELVKTMENTTCLDQATHEMKLAGYPAFFPDYFTTSELEGFFKQCVREGEIK